MRRKTQLLVCGAAAVALTATVAARYIEPPAGLTASAVASARPIDRAGVAYNPMAPLNAVVTPRFDPNKPPAEALVYHVSYTGGNGARVPALFVVPAKTNGPVPVIVVQHGLGQRKEDIFILSAAMTRRGYACFLMDAAYHGERVPQGGKTIGELNLSEFHGAVGQTIVDLRRGVDFLCSRPEIDAKRIGFVGASLGGILGGVFVADEPRIKAAALWAAGGDWEKIIANSQHRFADRFRKGPDAVAPEQVGQELADVDPKNTIALIAPRPLLFINGDKDTIVPNACADILYAAAKDPKKRSVLPGGHVPDVFTMARQTLDWLDTTVK